MKNVKIPKENMLNRYSKINKFGEYKEKKGKNKNIFYFPMIKLRMQIAFERVKLLAIALTIAVRCFLKNITFKKILINFFFSQIFRFQKIV